MEQGNFKKALDAIIGSRMADSNNAFEVEGISPVLPGQFVSENPIANEAGTRIPELATSQAGAMQEGEQIPIASAVNMQVVGPSEVGSAALQPSRSSFAMAYSAAIQEDPPVFDSFLRQSSSDQVTTVAEEVSEAGLEFPWLAEEGTVLVNGYCKVGDIVYSKVSGNVGNGEASKSLALGDAGLVVGLGDETQKVKVRFPIMHVDEGPQNILLELKVGIEVSKDEFSKEDLIRLGAERNPQELPQYWFSSQFSLTLILPFVIIVYWSRGAQKWGDDKDNKKCESSFPMAMLIQAINGFVLPSLNAFLVTNMFDEKRHAGMNWRKAVIMTWKKDAVSAELHYAKYLKSTNCLKRIIPKLYFAINVYGTAWFFYCSDLMFSSAKGCGKELWSIQYVMFWTVRWHLLLHLIYFF